MDKYNDEIVAIYNSIGYLQDGKYIKEPDCNSCLRDLLKFIRIDNQHTFLIRRQLGESNIVANDLIPLVKQHCLNDNELFDLILRLLVTLTNPTILLFKEEMPDDKEKKKIYLELNQHLFNYKSAFAYDVKFWSVIAKQMLQILQIEKIERLEEDKIMLERMLILIRNVLHISSDDEYNIVYGEDNLHDKCILSFKLACIYDIFLYICQKPTEHDYCFHILEIFSLIYREQSAKELAELTNSIFMSEIEKRNEIESLRELQKRKSLTSNNHQKFKYERFKESSYVIKNFKTIGNQDFICHKTISDISEINLEKDKKILRKAKNRRHLKDNQLQNNSIYKNHSSSLEVKSHLRDLASSFVSQSYNSLMKTVRYYLDRSKSQKNDETYYLWSAYFFMEFNRYSNADVKYLEETFSFEFLHYLYCLIETYLESLKIMKKNFIQWSKRLHYAMKAYRELIYSIAHIKINKDYKKLDSINEMQKKLFYDQDYRDLLKSLLLVYDPIKMSDAYLNDLIDANHLFLKMLENYCKKNENIIVANKVRKKKKLEKESNSKIDDPELIWTEISSQVSTLLQENIDLSEISNNLELNLFSTLCEYNRDDQKLNVMKKINILLYSKQVKESIFILRTAREFFLDDCENAFGVFDIKLEDELVIIRDILLNKFLLDLNKDEIKKLTFDKNLNEIVDESEDKLEDEDHHNEIKYKDQKFNFKEFIKSYASQKMIAPYYLSLKNYGNNSTKLNNSIIKMFHRIAFDCEMYVMFFQVSFFRIIQKILNEHFDNEYYLEIIRFGLFIIRKFFTLASNNKYIYVENLFTKSSKEAYILEYGEKEDKDKEPKRKRKKIKTSNNNDELIKSDDLEESILSELDEEKFDNLFTNNNLNENEIKINIDEDDIESNNLVIDEKSNSSTNSSLFKTKMKFKQNKIQSDDDENDLNDKSSIYKIYKKKALIEDDEIDNNNSSNDDNNENVNEQNLIIDKFNNNSYNNEMSLEEEEEKEEKEEEEEDDLVFKTIKKKKVIIDDDDDQNVEFELNIKENSFINDHKNSLPIVSKIRNNDFNNDFNSDIVNINDDEIK